MAFQFKLGVISTSDSSHVKHYMKFAIHEVGWIMNN